MSSIICTRAPSAHLVSQSFLNDGASIDEVVTCVVCLGTNVRKKHSPSMLRNGKMMMERRLLSEILLR